MSQKCTDVSDLSPNPWQTKLPAWLVSASFLTSRRSNKASFCLFVCLFLIKDIVNRAKYLWRNIYIYLFACLFVRFFFFLLWTFQGNSRLILFCFSRLKVHRRFELALMSWWASPSCWRTARKTPTTPTSFWHTQQDSRTGSWPFFK